MHRGLWSVKLIERGLWVNFISFTLCGLGCSDITDTESNSFSTKTQAVLGGEPSDNEAVLMVQATRSDSVSLCTGSLIAPRLLLTARHCVSTYIGGDYTCTIDGDIDRSRPRTPADAGEMGSVLDGAEVSIYQGSGPDFSLPITTGQQVLAPDTTTICRNDIALVVLNDPLDLPILPMRLSSTTYPGEKVTVVGYGMNDEMLTERRQRLGVTVLGVGPSEFFDVQGQAMPRTFVIESSVCPGDSGGPALSDDTGEILGVFSLYRGDCHSSEARNFYSQLAPYEALLKAGFDAVGMDFPLIDDGQEPAHAGAGGELTSAPHDAPANHPSATCGIDPWERRQAGSTRFGVLFLLLAVGLHLRRSGIRSAVRS